MIRLTQTVQKGGCAAKISAQTLRDVLGSLDLSSPDPAVLIDGKDFDDAGIYRVSDTFALVQTLDFFTPIVDSPRRFGEIAAANALSDVYAMGGEPKTAMAILAFPLATLDPEIMRDVMAGAQAKIREAGASLLGGHSIDDDTLKFGLSVTGYVDPRSMWTNSTARPGDALILTKALGTGTLTAGLKNSDYTEAQISEALDSMSQLNRVRDLLTPTELAAIHAATDITGFGLAGHSMQLAKASKVQIQISLSALPLLDRALESLAAENLTRAHRTNREYTQASIKGLKEIETQTHLTARVPMLFDPQTSGGLLLSVEAKHTHSVLANLKRRFPHASLIGKVQAVESAAGASTPFLEVLE